MSEPDDLENRAPSDSPDFSPSAASQMAHRYAYWATLMALFLFLILPILLPDEPRILILPAFLFMLSMLAWASRSLGYRLQFTTGWLLGLILTMGGALALSLQQEQPGMRWLALPVASVGWLWLLDRILRRQVQQREALIAKEMAREQRLKRNATTP